MYTEKSFTLKPADHDRKWFVVDAEGQVVGRLASKIADVLRGKNNPQFTPHTDSGHHVVVVNADKVVFKGNKWDQKIYYRHTNHIGGLKERTAREQLEKRPDLIILNAVKGMLPKGPLGRKQLTKLRVFAGENHTHDAQKPEKLEL